MARACVQPFSVTLAVGKIGYDHRRDEGESLKAE